MKENKVFKNKKNNLNLCIENGSNKKQDEVKRSLYNESRNSARKQNHHNMNTITDFNERKVSKTWSTARYFLNTIYNKSMQFRNWRVIKGLALSSK